jgi:hypothetical protein
MRALKIAKLLFLLFPFLSFAENIEDELQRAGSGFAYDRYPPIYYSNAHHHLVLVTVLPNGDYTLELEDGSVWKISMYDGRKACNWLLDSPLTITQNNRWFTRHDYRIINNTDSTSVEANLFLGPVLLGNHSRFIVGIDYYQRQILLNDNTHWDVSYLDKTIFENWVLNDYVILGINSNTSIWDSTSDALLINVRMNTCARAKQF